MVKYIKHFIGLSAKKQKILINICIILKEEEDYYLYYNNLKIIKVYLESEYENESDELLYIFKIQEKQYKYSKKNKNIFIYIGEINA